MELNEASWFIDAWAVFDGIAFASYRAEDSEPEEIVSLHPPYWTPVPISSLALAGGAARRGFQEGFFTDDGDEIAFDDLEEIIEIVRRGYLSGGIDPGGELEPAPVPPWTPESSEPNEPHRFGEELIENYDREPEVLDGFFARLLHQYNGPIERQSFFMFESLFARAEQTGDASAHAMARAWLRCSPVAADVYSMRLAPWYPWGAADYGLPPRFLWKVGLPVPIGPRMRTVGDVIMATGSSVEFVRFALSSDLGAFSFLFAHTVYASLSATPAVAGVNRSFIPSVATSIRQMLPRRLDRRHAASRAMAKLVDRLMSQGGRAVREAMREDDEPMISVTY